MARRLITASLAKTSLVKFVVTNQGGRAMLETIIIILLILWLLGMISGQSLGGMLWVLLVVAAVLFVVRLLAGRRTV